jgi:hypothetical protein
LGGFNKKTRQDNPTTITGYYLGTKYVPSPKSKSGKAAIHVFQTEDGNVGVWGKTDLDRKMEGLTNQLGSLVRVTQKGTKPTKGGNDMYMFRVEVDSDNRIEVTAAPSTLESEEETYEEETYTDEEYDEEPNAVFDRIQQPTAPAKAAAVPDAARQAKVKAMLAKTRTA